MVSIDYGTLDCILGGSWAEKDWYSAFCEDPPSVQPGQRVGVTVGVTVGVGVAAVVLVAEA